MVVIIEMKVSGIFRYVGLKVDGVVGKRVYNIEMIVFIKLNIIVGFEF